MHKVSLLLHVLATAFLLCAGVNVATVPSSGEQVTVNNVNNGKNQQFYLDNVGLTTLPTTILVAVTPNTPLTVELVVADVADSAFPGDAQATRLCSLVSAATPTSCKLGGGRRGTVMFCQLLDC